MSKMVQVFMVLRCYSCETFQVHQVKKSSNKWLCKICNEKQSVQKVYGQGKAADCRQHVQKLNMKRGEKETAEQQMLNHPPEDYAETFDKEQRHDEHESEEHPVLLSDGGTRRNRWKLYTDPQDSTSEEELEEGGSTYTTERTHFDQSRSRKKRRELQRHGSDPAKPHPLSKSSRRLPPPDHVTSSGTHPHTAVHPYSSVSDEMGQLLLESKSSCYVHTASDRYHKLDQETADYSGLLVSPHSSLLSHSKSLDHLMTTSKPHDEKRSKVVPNHSMREGQGHMTSHMTHEDKMACIRDDIGRFSRNTTKVASGNQDDDEIPTVSSRWSKFMTAEDRVDEEEDEEEEEEEEGKIQTHMLQSRMAVAKYN